jgi:hypothetical protein
MDAPVNQVYIACVQFVPILLSVKYGEFMLDLYIRKSTNPNNIVNIAVIVQGYEGTTLIT